MIAAVPPDAPAAPVSAAPPWLRPAMLITGSVLLAVSIVVTTVQNLNSTWTPVRLAPTFALVRGYPLYSLPTQPPWVMVGYGPLYPWMYLPCVFAHDPATAVAAGTALAHLYLLVPVALLCWAFSARLTAKSPAGPGTRAPLALSGLLCFGVLMCLVSTEEYIGRRVHVDAPTFGLLLLACYAALRAELPVPIRRGLGWTMAAGICAGMSLCCKANVLGSIGALGLYVWWSVGWRRMLAYALGAAAAVALVYGWAVWQSGAAAIVHNFHTLSRFPWYTFNGLQFNIKNFFETSRDVHQKLFVAAYLLLVSIQTYALPFLVTALFAYWLSRRAPDAASTGTIDPAEGPGRMIGCLLWVALLGVPGSVASLAKYGGDINGWAFVSLPLSVAVVLAAMALLQRATRAEHLAAHAVLGAAALVVLLGSALNLVRLDPRRGTAMGEAFRTIKAYPGQCYFASDPLAHLLAGERFRPNLDAVYSYWVGESPVDATAFRTVISPNLKYVMISYRMTDWGGDELHRLLPEESVRTDCLGLKFHEVWAQPQRGPARP